MASGRSYIVRSLDAANEDPTAMPLCCHTLSALLCIQVGSALGTHFEKQLPSFTTNKY